MIHPPHEYHLLRKVDFTPAEWMPLIDLVAELKAEKKEGREVSRLKGRNIALVFEKTSMRTCYSFEIVAVDQGAHTTFLDPMVSQIGHKESAADTTRAFGRLFDGIECHGDEQIEVDTLAGLSGVPVWNGPTDDWHPMQMLCDVLTMRKHAGKSLSEMSYAYVGDACFNTGHSPLINDVLVDADARIVASRQLWPDEECIANAKKIVAETGARIILMESVDEGVAGMDLVHTDIWVSAGEPKEVWDERTALLSAHRVSAGLMAKAASNAKLMHCPSAFHDHNTAIGEEILQVIGFSELEVTNEVLGGLVSIVFDQAENRMHAIKTIMVATFGDRHGKNTCDMG